MEKSIDTLRAEMWRDRYTAILNQYRALAEREQIMRKEYDAMARDLDDFYEERCDLKEALLREKEDSEKYSREAVELRLRCEKLQEKIDEYETRNSFLQAEQGTLSYDADKLHQKVGNLEDDLLQKKFENERLHQCLKDLVDAGTDFLMSVRRPINGINGSREAQLRDAIEKGRKWNE